MSGLDKIIEEIGASAKAEADIILQKADQYCEEYMANVKKEVSRKWNTLKKCRSSEKSLQGKDKIRRRIPREKCDIKSKTAKCAGSFEKSRRETGKSSGE